MNNIETLPRKSNSWVTPKELRGLLKANLGLNARQVSVKTGSSMTYLTITIRDPKVSVSKVEQFAKTLDTWNMDMTDYVTGQSVRVELSDEVKDALAESKLDLVEACEMPKNGQGREVVPGVMLWHSDHNMWLERSADHKRFPYIWAADLEQKNESALKSLALHLALLTMDQAA